MTSTAIEWAEHVWNPVVGCSFCSEGCRHCYAALMAARLEAMGQADYEGTAVRIKGQPAEFTGLVRTLEHKLDVPTRRKKPTIWFVNSMSDLFHDDVPTLFVAEVFKVMRDCPQHTFLILTKRPGRMAAVVRDVLELIGEVNRRTREPIPLPNVWLGTSIENDRYCFRANHLRDTPAAVRFLSCEPLLGPLPRIDLDGIDWLIAGGESGRGARPMHPQWVRWLRDRCILQGVPFFFKQWGEWQPTNICYSYWPTEAGTVVLHRDLSSSLFVVTADLSVATSAVAVLDSHQAERLRRVGKHAAGRVLDGRTWDERPAVVA